MVQAEVSGLRTALAADDKWDMALPITGSTLPIKPLAHIDCFIKRRCVCYEGCRRRKDP